MLASCGITVDAFTAIARDVFVNQFALSQARRFYHHVYNGGHLTPDDVSFLVQTLENAQADLLIASADHAKRDDELTRQLALMKLEVNRLRDDNAAFKRAEQVYNDLITTCNQEIEQLSHDKTNLKMYLFSLLISLIATFTLYYSAI